MLYSLKSLMWRQVGLKRTRDGLAEALHRIGFWNHYLLRSGQDSTRAHELANMLTVSALVAHAAFERAESRGTHYRSDHPEREDSRWCRRIALQIEPDGSIRADPLDTFPPTDRPLRNPSSGPMGPTTDSENPDGD
jgi:succinate dehydrogenase/fumarate reductase flavoprotein subunit